MRAPRIDAVCLKCPSPMAMGTATGPCYQPGLSGPERLTEGRAGRNQHDRHAPQLAAWLALLWSAIGALAAGRRRHALRRQAGDTRHLAVLCSQHCWCCIVRHAWRTPHLCAWRPATHANAACLSLAVRLAALQHPHPLQRC